MGGMAACILLAGKIMQPVAGLITLMIRWKHFAVANQEFSKFINIMPEIINPNIIHKQLTIINGEIVLNNMNYFFLPKGNWEIYRIEKPIQQFDISFNKDFMDKKISVLVSNAHKALSKDPGMFFNYL